MNSLSNNVRLRLRLTFFFVIAVSFLSTAIAIWRFQLLSAETEALTQHPLVKERLIAQWLLNLSVSSKRTAAVARTADPMLAQVFAAESRESSQHTDLLQEKVERLLDTSAERQQFALALEARRQFIDTRDRVMALKSLDRGEDAVRLYEQGFVQAGQRYADAVQGLLEFQQREIDAEAADMLAEARHTEMLITLLCAITTAGSIAAWILFSRLLFGRLGGEPAEAVAVAASIASGNLGTRITLRPGDQGSLLHALQRMRDSLVRIVAEVRHGTASILASVDAVAAENQELAQRTERQASALEESASSIQQLTEDVRQTEAHIEQARQLALKAARAAQQGGAMVGELTVMMNGIDASSGRIADIVAVIDGIAFQTNILALNAAVEAARAGHQGRGFAVVAGEVRALAQRSAGAAREIKTLIKESTQRATNGAELAGRAMDGMASIVSGIGSVTGIMDRIVVSAHEQSAGIGQVYQAISDMDRMTQQNAALAEESAVASQTMMQQALALSRQVAAFRLAEEETARPLPCGFRPAAMPRLASMPS